LTATPEKTDVVVVGGGPAGLAAAIAARLKGFDVAVADGAHPPIDKACGEGLMPDSFGAVHKLGIRIDAEQAFPFRGIRFLGEGASVEANFPGGSGIAMRRPCLHQALVDRANEVGVTLLWGGRVVGLTEDGVALDGHDMPRHDLRCRWVVGADGQKSRVRRWAALDGARHESFRFGFRRHYRISPWTDYMEIYWGPGSQMYVSPVNRGEVCVALITRDARMRLEQALPQFPDLSRRLAGATVSSTERGAITASRSLRRVFRGRTVLIGDASGSVDAITGEGLSLSFHQAIALGNALAAGDIRAYQDEHRRLAQRPELMAKLMLSLDRFPTLRGRVLRAMASDPEIFATMLAMHVGAISPGDFLMHGMLPLGRQMLTAI
jgi:flavin-dependent dehydrogenase